MLLVGSQLVPAVTELIVAELMYLEKQGATLPIEMLINSSGTTRQDGEIVGLASATPCCMQSPDWVQHGSMQHGAALQQQCHTARTQHVHGLWCNTVPFAVQLLTGLCC